jgi:cytochrome c biogenesis protein CcmG/thiol:disulfide interchange protein DsbE
MRFNVSAGAEVFVVMGIKQIAFLAGTVVIVVYILKSGVGNPRLVREGSPAPKVVVKDLKGIGTPLENLKGRVVFVNFWSTTCGPCAAEMPDLNRLAQRFAGRKFDMMAISLDRDAEDVSDFYAEKHLTMPAYFDPYQRIANKFNITGTPETFVIDSEGTIAKFYWGAQPWTSPQMVAMFDRMIPQ